MLAEYTSDPIVTVPPADATSYLTSDQLGSPRVVTRSDGSVKARHDYLPFGEDVASNISGRSTVTGYASQDSLRQKFTSKERDTESGLDYFLARYYSSAQGRFTSPDEFTGGPSDIFVLGNGNSEKQSLPYGDITNPQSLNKYQYGYNNPLRYIDPNGHMAQDDWWDRLMRYILGSKTDVKIDEDRTKEQQEPKLLGLDEEKMVDKHREVLIKTHEMLADVIELVDPTGTTSVIREYIRGNNEGVVIAIVGMVAGGRKSSLTFGEAKKLVGQWGKGSFSKISDLIRHSFSEHGAQVGAKDVWQFLRKATNFSEKGAFRKVLNQTA